MSGMVKLEFLTMLSILSFFPDRFKAILCSLILNLKFESVPGWEIEPKQSVVLKGRIIGQEHLGMQIPVRVSKV